MGVMSFLLPADLPPENVTAELPRLSDIPLKNELTTEERKQLGEMLADDIWFFEQARREYQKRLRAAHSARKHSVAAPRGVDKSR